MKKFMVAVMVLGLVGFAVAQDLDAPTMGASLTPQEANDGQGMSSVYDMLIATIQRTEEDYIAGRTYEGTWLRWGMPMIFGDTGRSWSSYSDVYDVWDQLTPAEWSAAQAEFRQSWDRVIAAGLN